MVLSMKKFEGKVAIVTGASAGIGAAICKALVKEGVKVVGFARRTDKVDELAKELKNCTGKLFSYKVDVKNEGEIKQGFEWVTKNVGPVTILVNNAGILPNTSLIDGNTQIWKNVLDTNVMGLSICSKEAYLIMKQHKIDIGHIINLNSIAGHGMVFFPQTNMYPASKFAVTALTESFRRELVQAKSKIKITSISPGYVDTEILRVSNFFEDAATVDSMLALKSEDIADAVIYVLSTPPGVQVHELIIRPQGEIF